MQIPMTTNWTSTDRTTVYYSGVKFRPAYVQIRIDWRYVVRKDGSAIKSTVELVSVAGNIRMADGTALSIKDGIVCLPYRLSTHLNSSEISVKSLSTNGDGLAVIGF